MPFKLEEHSGVLIKKAARLFEQVANRNLDELGVTYSQTIFLVRLWERDGQSQAELTKSSGLKQPTVVRILDRMERDKLIKRVRNQDDKRIFNFFLTEKARKSCEKLDVQARDMMDIAMVGFSQKAIKEFNKQVSKIIQNLENDLA